MSDSILSTDQWFSMTTEKVIWNTFSNGKGLKGQSTTKTIEQYLIALYSDNVVYCLNWKSIKLSHYNMHLKAIKWALQV